jgi:predicted nuclease of restriction endonuclease-like (RecB) superfamily
MKNQSQNSTVEITNTNQLLNQAIQLVRDARQFVVRQTNSVMVFTYFQLGRLIVEQKQGGKVRAAYGKDTIQLLSKRLTSEFGNGFSADNLENMRKFFLAFQNKNRLLISETLSRKLDPEQIPQTLPEDSQLQISETVSRKSFADIFPLSWSHYVLLSRIENREERSFYEIESTQVNWSVRELQRQINTGLFERLALSTDKQKIKQLAAKGQIIEKPEDVLKSPFVLEFLGLQEKASFSETDLETAIISKIEHFLLEMGKGFLFQGRQVRFSFDEEHFFVDLVLYNRLLQCFVLIDLKIGKLKHQDIGQMQMYVNYYDRFIKQDFEKTTIGIIICKDKSEAVVEITLPKENNQIFASQYKLYLPSKVELIKLVTE